ncbi:MAG: carbon-nitrogen hydrolase family protein [Planctomycetota bacterium]|nr:carbon-nitrogen hydrolase family protein [Planctomycetota bacterium]MDA1215084.1 carbon-nitrogen hydrolase family protein [Planctomycetota bacterium]
MNPLTIGLAQVKQTADFDTNAATIFSFLEKAAAAGVQILCFPEAQTVGYRADISTADAPVPVERLRELHDSVAARCGELKIACILGTEIPLESDPQHGKPYNSVVVISESGTILGTHHKTRLTPLDAMAYTPGITFETFELCGVKVGVVICFEGFRFAETTRECVRQGARLVFHPQNNTTRPNDWKIPIHHAMIVTRAAENTIWFASCNASLDHQNCRSLVVAPDGQIAAQSELKCEELVVAEIVIDRATRAMFNYDMEACAEMLFAKTVARGEYAAILPPK